MAKHVPFNERHVLARVHAAQYCDMSATHFDKCVAKKLLPPPNEFGGKKLWVRKELDEALEACPSEADLAHGAFDLANEGSKWDDQPFTA